MANSVKIPVELEMSSISSQISSLRQLLKGVKVDSSSYAQLNKMLQNLEKTFGNLQVESKKTFSLQAEISHFQKGLSSLGAQAQVFQDTLSKVNLKDLNIDTSAYERAFKKVQELQNIISSEGQIGTSFNGTEIEKLAQGLKVKIKPDTTFEELVTSFDNAADKIEIRIQEINNKIAEIGKQKISTDDFSQYFDEMVARHTTGSYSKESMENAAKEVARSFGVQSKSNHNTKANNIEDFVSEQTSKMSSALQKRREQLEQEIAQIEADNEKIKNALAMLDEKNGTLTQGEKKEISEKTGTSLGRNLKVDKIKTDLSSKLVDTNDKQQELKNISSESWIQEQIQNIANSIEQSQELAVRELVSGIRSYLKSKGISNSNIGQIIAKGENETWEEYKNRIIKAIEDFNRAKEELIQEQETLKQDEQTKLIGYQNASSNVKTQQQQNQQAVEQAKAQMPAAIQGLEGEQKALERVAESATNADDAVKGLNEETEKAGRTADKASENLQTLSTATESLGQLKRIVSYWFGFHNVMRTVSSTIKGAVSTIRELDDVMTEISIVTDMTQEDLWGQMDKYASIAQEYGTSIKGVYEVSQLYYQQGLQTSQVWDLTTETLKMAKIAGLDYATAADYMTVAIRGFKMEMSEAQRVTDVYSAVAAATASDTEELAVAMSKTASSAASVGSSFEATTAMIATMVSTTRESATNIGSAMKSIISRYGEMTADPSSLVDGEGEEMSLNKVDKALKSIGISMQDTNGQFRDFDDVILELAAAWDTLDANSQRY